MRIIRYSFISLCMLVGVANPAQARVNIDLNFSVGPELVVVPGYPVYYAPDVDRNFFYYDGMYWLYEDDEWYSSDWYNGPWEYVDPEYVPLFVLRIPVRYYRRPPVYFRGWIVDAPPHWGHRWGDSWEHNHRGWDHWDRHRVPQRAPLPNYHRDYPGNHSDRDRQDDNRDRSNNDRRGSDVRSNHDGRAHDDRPAQPELDHRNDNRDRNRANDGERPAPPRGNRDDAQPRDLAPSPRETQNGDRNFNQRIPYQPRPPNQFQRAPREQPQEVAAPAQQPQSQPQQQPPSEQLQRRGPENNRNEQNYGRGQNPGNGRGFDNR